MSDTSAFTSAGTRLYITTGKPAAFTISGYEALTWIEINEIVEMGEIGRVYTDVPHAPVRGRQVYHKKGNFDEGGLSIQAGHSPTDKGQIALRAASKDDNDFYFKLLYADGKTEAESTVEYFPAQVFPQKKRIGDVDSIVSKTFELIINGDILTNEATEPIEDKTIDEMTIDEIDALEISEFDSTPIF